MVGQAAGELEDGLFGYLVAGEARVAAPADLDPGEEIGLGAGELVEALRVELGVGAEDSGSGVKMTVVPRRLGAAPTVSSGEVATPFEKAWR